jgi:hypothetical protein
MRKKRFRLLELNESPEPHAGIFIQQLLHSFKPAVAETKQLSLIFG